MSDDTVLTAGSALNQETLGMARNEQEHDGRGSWRGGA